MEPAPGNPGPRGRYRIVRSRVTGLPVMHAPRGTPAVTSEEIRTLLSDFP